MTIQEIYSNKHLLLPKAVPVEKNYRLFVKELCEEYLDLLKSVNTSFIKVQGIKNELRISGIIKNQEKFTKGILDTIEIYFDGQPAKAYTQLAKTIDDRREKYKNLLNVKEFDVNENFYRIRKKEENFPLSSFEMFHIPFDLRGKVTTQRYSIPGFPSLYLAKTLYIAWEELNRPNLDSFQAVRLVSKRKINYLDLTASDWNSGNLTSKAYKYLMTWPLIAACSIKVKSYNDTFKPEYIIPQLLLQWVRNTGGIDGIKYSSTHISTEYSSAEAELYNLVLPVKENKDEGYCNHLTELFEITETISKQLLDYSNEEIAFDKKKIEIINKKIPSSLEIIKGRKFSYGHSVLGQIEFTLDNMKTKKINNQQTE